MTYQATTDATRTPYSPILSDLYTRKMETEAHLQAQAHQQTEARRQDSAAKWQAEHIRQQRQQQRR